MGAPHPAAKQALAAAAKITEKGQKGRGSTPGPYRVRSCRGFLIAGWHAHAAVCVGMLAAGAKACPANGVLGMPPA